MRHFILRIAFVAVLFGACTDYGTFPTYGTLRGQVTLGGGQQPGTNAILRVHQSVEDLSLNRNGQVVQMTGNAPTFSFLFQGLPPGTYYLNACFAFGCGFYQTGNGVPAAVQVTAGSTTTVNFTL